MQMTDNLSLLWQNTVDKLIKKTNLALLVGTNSWRDQFIEAITVSAGKTNGIMCLCVCVCFGYWRVDWPVWFGQTLTRWVITSRVIVRVTVCVSAQQRQKNKDVCVCVCFGDREE